MERIWNVRLTVIALAMAAFTNPSLAQEVTLKVHHFLPSQSVVPRDFIEPWARKVEKESEGRIKVEIYPSMQLGGRPPSLIDQAIDGVVDLVWTLPGYTPGRFPKTEAFELPFMPTDAEPTSRAFSEYFDKHLVDEFDGLKVVAVHVHSPGLLHVKGKGVSKLEDMEGLKIRGPTRMINALLEEMGAIPVGMPVPSVPEALSRGVIDGAAIPWEVAATLKTADMVDSHTDFSGDRSLYTATFVFAMNENSYEALPDDLKAVIDANSGIEMSAWIGRAMDAGDEPGITAAERSDNVIRTLDEEETKKWRDRSQKVTDVWIADMAKKGVDGKALVDDAKALIEKHSEATGL